MKKFDNKILILGYGSVSQCTIPLLFRLIDIAPANVTIMDFEDKAEDIRKWTDKGVNFVRDRVTQQNLGAILGKFVGAGDLLIDLAWNIDCCEILQWCHDNGVLYINTSVEIWDPYEGAENRHPTERTLYWRHMNVRRMTAGWDKPGPTAVIEHGANPGLISHWTNQGLLDIAERALEEKKYPADVSERIAQYAKDRTFNRLAMELGVKVIHCSERDTQISSRPKEVDEFVNTWSIEGFREEGTTTAEMGWGTHEKRLPANTFTHKDGPRNQICLARMGMNTNVITWVPPAHRVIGMVIRHGEAFTISDRLTVEENGKAIYRPTVHYAYCPCDAAIASLHEMRGTGYELQSNLRIMNDDIISGADILGALIMGHCYNSWWTGSDLSIEQTREIVPHQNATTLQVAISVIAASLWMMENPEEGVRIPGDLPHDFILGIARPYLGHNRSLASDWTPLKHNHNFFKEWNNPVVDEEDIWQFCNFITDGD